MYLFTKMSQCNRTYAIIRKIINNHGDITPILLKQPLNFKAVVAAVILAPDTAILLFDAIARVHTMTLDMYLRLLYVAIASVNNSELARAVAYYFGQQHGVIAAYTYTFELALAYDNDVLWREYQCWVDVTLHHVVAAIKVANGRAALSMFETYFGVKLNGDKSTDASCLLCTAMAFAIRYDNTQIAPILDAMVRNACIRYSICCTENNDDAGWHGTLRVFAVLFTPQVFNYSVLEIVIGRMNNHALLLLLEMAPPDVWKTITYQQASQLAARTVCNPVAQQLLTRYTPHMFDFRPYV